MSKNKILFIPGYFYLAKEQFLEIAGSVSDEYESTFLRIDMEGSAVERINNVYKKEDFLKHNVGFEVCKLSRLRENIKIGDDKGKQGKDEDLSCSKKISEPVYTRLKRVLIKVISKYEGREVDISAPLREGGHGFIVSGLCIAYHFMDRTLDVILFLRRAKYLFSRPEKNLYFQEIKEVLRSINPTCVVVNSDLGHIGVLYALVACQKMKIQVYIIPTADIETVERSMVVKIRMKITDFLFGVPFENFLIYRLHIFASNLVGEFSLKSKILTSSTGMMEKLVSQGIKKKRVVLCNLPTVKRINKEEEVKKELKIEGSKKIIVFYTECLHEVYPRKDVIKAHHQLGRIFKKIMENLNVVILVKPHPRELQSPTLKTDVLVDTFGAQGVQIVENIETDVLLGSSFLNMAHYSKVLITSCVLGVPILSFSFQKKRSKNSFIVRGESSFIEVQEYELLYAKLSGLISGEDEYEKLKSICKEVKKDFVGDEKSDFVGLSEFFKKDMNL